MRAECCDVDGIVCDCFLGGFVGVGIKRFISMRMRARYVNGMRNGFVWIDRWITYQMNHMNHNMAFTLRPLLAQDVFVLQFFCFGVLESGSVRSSG